jgi:hypothetical protein
MRASAGNGELRLWTQGKIAGLTYLMRHYQYDSSYEFNPKSVHAVAVPRAESQQDKREAPENNSLTES